MHIANKPFECCANFLTCNNQAVYKSNSVHFGFVSVSPLSSMRQESGLRLRGKHPIAVGHLHFEYRNFSAERIRFCRRRIGLEESCCVELIFPTSSPIAITSNSAASVISKGGFLFRIDSSSLYSFFNHIISSIIHQSKFQKMIDENEVLHSIPLPLAKRCSCHGGRLFCSPSSKKGRSSHGTSHPHHFCTQPAENPAQPFLLRGGVTLWKPYSKRSQTGSRAS